MRRALLSGGIGFIGRALAAQLSARGIEFAGVGRSNLDGPGPYYFGDAPWSKADWGSAIEEFKPDAIFHLAGIMRGDDAQMHAVNAGSAQNLLSALRETDRLIIPVLAGSATEYGDAIQDGAPITENSRCAPAGPYGCSKLAQTQAALAFQTETGKRVVAARIFNPVGLGMPTHLALSNFAEQVRAMPSDGGVLVTGNLDVARDLIHVDEAARLLIALAETPAANGIVNVCSGVAYDLRALVNQMIAQSNKPIALRTDPARLRANDLRVIVGSTNRLNELGIFPAAPDMASVTQQLLNNH